MSLFRVTAKDPRDADLAKQMQDCLNLMEDEIMDAVADMIVSGSHWFTPYEPDYQKQCQLWQDDGGK